MNRISAKKENHPNRQRGITLFLALVITNLLIVISYSLTEIALKSTEFSVSGRDSQVAYYAADSALECALFWDSYTDFAETNEGLKFGGKFNPTALSTFTCGGRAIGSGVAIQGTTTTSRVGGAPTSVFGYDFQDGINGVQSCAIVTVGKSGGQTHIESHGFNSCNTSNQRRTERGIETTYGVP